MDQLGRGINQKIMGFYFFLLGGVGCAADLNMGKKKRKEKKSAPNSTRGLFLS
jgi:hypothetical protein